MAYTSDDKFNEALEEHHIEWLEERRAQFYADRSARDRGYRRDFPDDTEADFQRREVEAWETDLDADWAAEVMEFSDRWLEDHQPGG